MDIDLTGRVVAITGASSGIGEATALAAAEAGAAVAVAARRRGRIEALARRIEKAGGRALPIAIDVGEEDEARVFIERTHAELGRLDALVNNAGVMLLGTIEQAPTREWRRMIDTNVYGVLYATHAAVPLMKAQGFGHIVTVGSVDRRAAAAGSGVYSLTAAGISAFTESLRQELATTDIRVTTVQPGLVLTELQSHVRRDVWAAASRQYDGVIGLQARDIANAIVYTLGQPDYVAINELVVRPTRQLN
ncbi:MAG TPA: SDR family NAD(P)-dependent oxidoreductase [Conexibacter sp.]|jgi:NADP-dependent 3-hydroxy acid dehydrogenase YdfG